MGRDDAIRDHTTGATTALATATPTTHATSSTATDDQITTRFMTHLFLLPLNSTIGWEPTR